VPTPRIRREVSVRAHGCCEYCLSQRQFSSDSFSIEHIVPQSRGGTEETSNLALACQGCNNCKYSHSHGIDPVSGEEAVLYNPRTDIWVEHFAWSHDFSEIVGLTAKGRAAIVRLRLNRPEVVALRKILAAARLHPPDYPFAGLNA